MQEHCRAAEMMLQKIPEQLEIVETLPRNPTFKIMKSELVTRFEGSAPDPSARR
jgi:acyl-CoA synthetase (AMP-forming)/AMP-acid ligase II